MNMREQIAALTQQVEDLKAKVVQQNVEFSQKQDDHLEDISRLNAEHKKVLESKNSSLDYSSKQRTELQEQINTLHDILDVIPGVTPREKEAPYNSTITVSPMVRLASVLASKFNKE